MSEAIPTIQYRDIQGFPGYRVGDDGSIWTAWTKSQPSAIKPTIAYIGTKWKPMKPKREPRTGYLTIQLRRAGTSTCFRIHSLVLKMFIGPRPDGMEACHGDGNPTHNALSNLRWDIHKGNADDMVKHGTSCRGSKNHSTKLTEEQARAVLKRLKDGESRQSIARYFGLTYWCIRALDTGHSWAWLKEKENEPHPPEHDDAV